MKNNSLIESGLLELLSAEKVFNESRKRIIIEYGQEFNDSPDKTIAKDRKALLLYFSLKQIVDSKASKVLIYGDMPHTDNNDVISAYKEFLKLVTVVNSGVGTYVPIEEFLEKAAFDGKESEQLVLNYKESKRNVKRLKNSKLWNALRLKIEDIASIRTKV